VTPDKTILVAERRAVNSLKYMYRLITSADSRQWHLEWHLVGV